MLQDTTNNNNENKEYARTRCVHVPFAINPESKKQKTENGRSSDLLP